MREGARPVVVLVGLVVGSATLGPWGLALGATGSGPVAAAEQPDVTISTTYTVELPADPSDGVVVTATTPDVSGVEEFELSLGEHATVVSSEGYDCGADSCRSTRAESLSVTYRVALQDLETAVRGEDWAVVSGHAVTAREGASWSGRGPGFDVAFEERLQVAGEGRTVDDEAVLLGPHRVYERQVDGQTLQVLIPGTLSTRPSPRTILGALGNASTSIAGDDDRATGIVVSNLPRLARGLTFDDRTFLIESDGTVVAWLHEYVHTQQEFYEARSMEWFTEGSAEFYAHHIAVRHGYAPWGAYAGMLREGHDDTSVLSREDTWETSAEYNKGGAVIALLDRRLRTATDGEATFRDVWTRLQGREGLTVAQFRRTLRAVGNASVAETARRYVQTDAVVPTEWSRDAYTSTVGVEPAVLRIERVNVTATGPLGARRVAVTDQRATVAPGETVQVTLRATNYGGQPGLVSVQPSVGHDGGPDRVLGTWTTWLQPGASATTTMTYRVTATDSFELYHFHSTGGRGPSMITFDVTRPNGSVAVERIDVDGEPVVGEPLEIDVALENADGRIAAPTLAIAVDGAVRSRQSVVVPPGGRASVSDEVTFEEPGTHRIAVRNTSMTVTVSPPATASSGGTTTRESQDAGDDSETASVHAGTGATTAGSRTAVTHAATTRRPEPTTTTGPGFGPWVAVLAVAVSITRRVRPSQ